MSEQVLGVEDVMRRYGYADARAARRVMNAAGAFKVGARLFVHEERLRAHEEGLVAARKAGTHSEPGNPTRSVSRPRRHRTKREPLPLDWWREGLDRGNVGPSNDA